MPNLEWDIAMNLGSPFGALPINVPFDGGDDGVLWLYEILDPSTYSIVPQKFRPVVDSLSQADGMSIQPPFIDGLVATLEVAFLYLPHGAGGGTAPACADRLREMNELLMGVVNSLRTYPTDVSTQQYLWQPTGATQRLLDGVMLASWPVPNFANSPQVRTKFQVASPYPYALTNAPHTVGPIAAGGSAPLTNAGNSPGLPILMIPGAAGATYCKVTLTTFPSSPFDGLTLVYDSTLPGALTVPAGHTLQIDFHEGSCLLDGDPTLDYIAGLNPTATTLFPVQADAVTISTLNADAGNTSSVSIVSYDYWV